MTQILGVIGGSGIDKIDELVFIKNHKIDTPWGKPSGSILECKFNDLKIFFYTDMEITTSCLLQHKLSC